MSRQPRYIDADKLLDDVRRIESVNKGGFFHDVIKQILLSMEWLIGRQQPAEVEPVRHGQWIEHNDDDTVHCHCSVCEWESHWYEDDVYGMPRCPNCGARMEQVEDKNWRMEVSGWNL